MLAMYSEKRVPASIASAMTASGGSSFVPTSYLVSAPLTGSTISSTSPPDIAGIPLHPIWSGLTIDALIFGGGLLLLRWLLTAPGRLMRELSRMRRGRCISCGYDLGYDFVRGCPECGWRRNRTTCAPILDGDASRDSSS